jgi:dTMP kinase
METKRPLQFYNTILPSVDCAELHGTLIVIEGPDAVGRTTQVTRLRQWLEEEGHAVLDTGMARSALVGKGIQQAKDGNTLVPQHVRKEPALYGNHGPNPIREKHD